MLTALFALLFSVSAHAQDCEAAFQARGESLARTQEAISCHEAALSRMVQAGATRVTTIPALLEWQRDWKDHTHYDALMGILKQHAGAYGVGVEYAYTMVHKAAQSAKSPQIVTPSAH